MNRAQKFVEILARGMHWAREGWSPKATSPVKRATAWPCAHESWDHETKTLCMMREHVFLPEFCGAVGWSSVSSIFSYGLSSISTLPPIK